ncbi:acetolactate synthase large subunit [Lentzea alba]|uniref:acetolactate synthase large subunit n=1 Tax=Lentzea alba TaxID=2714351 RepID=UPI0039BFD961
MDTTGAGALVKALEDVGCEVIFGMPGGAILPAYDPLFDSKIRHVLVRHEQGAGHAAQGYAQATGRVGVCMATSGPGATNLVTPLADAYMDSVPIVAITGQVNRAAIGTDAFQEADIRSITLPITKHSFQVHDPADIPRVIAEAFELAITGRPGPVLVDLPKDVLASKTTYTPAKPATRSRPVLSPVQIRNAAQLIGSSKKPVFYIGGGVIRSGATQELLKLATKTRIPVVTTLMARGAFPDSNELHLGMPGMHGTVPAVAALQKADLLIALGTRFDDRVTGSLPDFAPHAAVIHADIDPAEISKNRKADVGIVGDCRDVLAALSAVTTYVPDLTEWWQYLDGLRTTYPLGYDWPEDGMLAPQYVIERLSRLAGPEAIYTAGVGQHQMWAAQYVKYERPGSFINSGGAGTMGFAVPAAMGAQAGAPDRTVWAIDGDGCFQMTNQELATCAAEGIPIKVAIINNGNLGMVRQWQTLFYDGRYSNTRLGTHQRHPDFVKLAEALGCVGLRCEDQSEVDGTILEAMAVRDRPVVIDFVVGQDAQVWPMVAAGTGNDEVMAARGIRPLFDEEE